jgi:hypothetical protein
MSGLASNNCQQFVSSVTLYNFHQFFISATVSNCQQFLVLPLSITVSNFFISATVYNYQQFLVLPLSITVSNFFSFATVYNCQQFLVLPLSTTVSNFFSSATDYNCQQSYSSATAYNFLFSNTYTPHCIIRIPVKLTSSITTEFFVFLHRILDISDCILGPQVGYSCYVVFLSPSDNLWYNMLKYIRTGSTVSVEQSSS